MIRIITVFVLTYWVQMTNAQKGVDQLVMAEKNFAAYSVNHSTKEAFLQFLDSNGIVFDNGKPVNGIQIWTSRGKNEAVLNWYPEYAEIAASGDFGYTTGPWSYKPSPADSVVARGRYITVWHVNKMGEWKFLVDLGVSNIPSGADSSYVKIVMPAKKFSKGSLKSMVGAENRFALEKNKSRKAKWLGAHSILNRNSRKPAISPDSAKVILSADPEQITYSINGSEIALSGDLGYIYGTALINGKTENYLRIWRMEKDAWKIAVEVLRF